MGNYYEPLLAAVVTNDVFDQTVIAGIDAILNAPDVPQDLNLAFVALKDHILDQTNLEFFPVYVTTFTQVHYGQSTYDVQKYFGIIIGKGLEFVASANVVLDTGDLSDANDLADLIVSTIEGEATSMEEATKLLNDRADAMVLDALVNDPIGAYILSKSGSEIVKDVTVAREEEVRYELDMPYVDPNEPISDDPSQFSDNTNADPTP